MQTPNRRVLIVDDNASIHEDFKKILAKRAADTGALAAAEAALFDDAPATDSTDASDAACDLDFALQGEEAVELVRRARTEGRPYALAFVDMRMPPGIDGVTTIERMWSVDTELQVVVCTAYSDHNWPDVVRRLGRTDRLLILKKPFDAVEVHQLATALTEKWNAAARERANLHAAVRAEGEARAYAASLETTNNAIEASWRRTEAELESRRRMMLDISDVVLTPTLGVLTRIIATRALNDQLDDELEQLIDHSTSLARTIQSLIELAEIDGGRAAIQPVPCSPREIADEVAAAARQAVGSKPIEVLYRCAAALPARVRSVPDHVKRVLTELIDNAVRHTERGSLTIEVDVQAANDGDLPMVRFAVTDTGSGIPDAALGRLFEPFCGADTDQRDTNHAGLGLAVCGRLASALGGNLRAVCRQQGGATFELFLPTNGPTG
ncbi:MAG: hybrid sensor histidine kinase/response regulator [Planctomycetes bacterium]|nr:hybrid sensor histidine kinase/response regulator [Planctomycetota bacterium]